MAYEKTKNNNGKIKTRKLGITVKILLAVAVCMQLLVSVIGTESYMCFRKEMVHMGVEEAGLAARTAVGQINGDMLKNLKPGDEDTEEYQQVLKQLRDLKIKCNMKYLFTLTTDGQKVYYGVDSDEGATQCPMISEPVMRWN